MANKLYEFSCELNAGRLIPCKNSIGGLIKIFLMPYNETLFNKFTFSDNEITEIGTLTIFEYDLRPNSSSFTSTINSSPVNGTTFYEQTLEVSLNKIVKEDLSQLDKVIKGRCQVFVLDANDNVFVSGTRFGCDVTAGAMATGTAKADMSGFTLTFTAQETENYIVKKSSGNPAEASYPFDSIGTPGNITITPGTTPA
tara:strand:+ start:12876 stop:13469 length:594 start_codon:yes stop_codon:yes gene_type:complete